MFNVISSIFTAIAKACESFTKAKEHQSETDVLKTKTKKSKAVEYAEKIIFIADSYPEVAKNNNYKRYRKLFFKYN